MYAAWMGIVLRPFMQRLDNTFETAAFDTDETSSMHALDQTAAPDFDKPSHHQ
jgi:hypothetical protein